MSDQGGTVWSRLAEDEARKLLCAKEECWLTVVIHDSSDSRPHTRPRFILKICVISAWEHAIETTQFGKVLNE